MAAFKPLYHQLKQHSVAPEMVAGLWILIQDIENRNYLHAYDIYMHLAVGEPPLESLVRGPLLRLVNGRPLLL